jgi:hypothetical protein
MLSLLGPLASILGIEVGEMVERLKQNGVLWGAILLFALVAFVFLLVGANGALGLWVGPLWAPFVMAGGAALVALVVYVATRISAHVAHSKEVQRRRSAETTALVTTAAVTAVPLLFGSPLMKRIGLPLGGALAALFILMKTRHGRDDSHETDQN